WTDASPFRASGTPKKFEIRWIFVEFSRFFAFFLASSLRRNSAERSTLKRRSDFLSEYPTDSDKTSQYCPPSLPDQFLISKRPMVSMLQRERGAVKDNASGGPKTHCCFWRFSQRIVDRFR